MRKIILSFLFSIGLIVITSQSAFASMTTQVSSTYGTRTWDLMYDGIAAKYPAINGWDSGTANANVIFTFQEAKKIKEFKIYPMEYNSTLRGLTGTNNIYVSNDGSSWSKVHTFSGGSGWLSWQFTNVTQKYKYYKLEIVTNTGRAGIGELQIILDEDTTAPAEISNLTTSYDYASATFNWTNPTDTDFSKVYIYKNGVKIAETSGTQYIATGLTSNTNYTFSFKTVDTNFNVSTGTNKTFTTEILDVTPPAEIMNLTVTELETTSARFNYTLPTDTDFFKVYVYENKGELVKVGETDQSSYTLSGLDPDTQYIIVFRTVDIKGNISTGVSKTFSTLAALSSLKVSDVSVSTKSDQVDLVWKNPTSKSFKTVTIYRKIGSNTSFIDLLNGRVYAADTFNLLYKPLFSTNGTEFSDLTVEQQTSYTYKLVTTDVYNRESEGVEVAATTKSKTNEPPDYNNVKVPINNNDLIDTIMAFIFVLAPLIVLTLVIFYYKPLIRIIKKAANNGKEVK